MHSRRGLLAGIVVLLAGPGACTTGRGGPRSVSVSLTRLQSTVAARFPRRYTLLQGLFDCTLQAPELSLLPERDHLAAQVPLQAGGALLARAVSGEAGIEFGLRYEAADHTLRATALQVRALRMDGVPNATAQAVRKTLSDVLRQSLSEVVLYHLRAQDLALADALGLQPGPITVTPEGLQVALVAKGPG
ncbi:MAG: hypothetical protein HKUEN07_36530 [Rhodocyclaceae bacterium]|nr:MAG: hypothetical protein HKUEN07_36530 [Rhodocyclaceae bacterium]